MDREIRRLESRKCNNCVNSSILYLDLAKCVCDAIKTWSSSGSEVNTLEENFSSMERTFIFSATVSYS